MPEYGHQSDYQEHDQTNLIFYLFHNGGVYSFISCWVRLNVALGQMNYFYIPITTMFFYGLLHL